MIFIKTICIFLLILLFSPFVAIGFATGILFRFIESGFIIGYSCLAMKYAKEINKEIKQAQSELHLRN